MKEDKTKEKMRRSKRASALAVGNVASSALEVHPDTAPPFCRQNNEKEKEGNDTKKKRSISGILGSPSSFSFQLEEHGVTQPPPPIIAQDKKDQKENNKGDKKNSLKILGAEEQNPSLPTLISSTEKENETRTNNEALQLAPVTGGGELPSPSSPAMIQNSSNINLDSTRQYNTEEGAIIMADSNQEEEEQAQQGDPQIFTVDNAFRVLTPEERRQQRLERERQSYPLIDGQPITSRRPSLTPSQQEAKQIKKENRRLIILFIVCAIILVIILVPSLLLANKKKNGANSNLATISPSPPSNPSTSLVPSFSPYVSIVPSSFPTTSSPTSTAFNDLMVLLGLEEEIISLNPNDYVFRSIQWMADQDQVTRAVLFQLRISGTEQQQQQDMGASLFQRFALVCLFFATEGDLWFDRLGFLNPFSHECQWRVFGREQRLPGGATINCVDNAIEGVALNENNLGGMIPTEIGLFTRLTWLEIPNNEIGGTLPSSLSRLSRLVGLILDRNKLSGSIPSELTTMNNLLGLRLALNDLTGPIPESIGDLTNLIFLEFGTNFLTGSIPSSIQNMTELVRLELGFSMLTSTLPTEINNLQQLEEYYVIGNMLTGTLPFVASANPLIEVFNCDLNDLAGDISRLTHLSRLRSLIFSRNKFMGTIPTELCSLSLLQFIHGASNMLTGSLPNCLVELTALRDFVFANNSLIGSIPTLPISLNELVLWRNQLTGRIPTGPFSNMAVLSLFTNNFTTGTIPTELFTLTNLRVLQLDACQLFGTIHTEIGLLTQLTLLNLRENILFGTIPSEIGMLQNLDRLGLSLNRFTGTIPSEMGRLTSLRGLNLNANLLTGPLPSTFVNLPVETFGQLSLFDNNLMGDVGFFCQDRTFGVFLADCLELTNCSCCTGCCDRQRAFDDQCVDFFNNL